MSAHGIWGVESQRGFYKYCKIAFNISKLYLVMDGKLNLKFQHTVKKYGLQLLLSGCVVEASTLN